MSDMEILNDIRRRIGKVEERIDKLEKNEKEQAITTVGLKTSLDDLKEAIRELKLIVQSLANNSKESLSKAWWILLTAASTGIVALIVEKVTHII